jgi:hypothetical protein
MVAHATLDPDILKVAAVSDLGLCGSFYYTAKQIHTKKQNPAQAKEQYRSWPDFSPDHFSLRVISNIAIEGYGTFLTWPRPTL